MKKDTHDFDLYVTPCEEARWAEPQELKGAPAISKVTINQLDSKTCGLPIIREGEDVYVDGSDTHSIIFGSTGSKKTRLFGMPLIHLFAMAGESFIATDPKGELYDRTSGYVKAYGYENIAVLDFRDLTKSDHWNPLWLPYQAYHSGKHDEAISMINDFINILSEPERASTQEPYWIESGVSMLFAFLLFFIATVKPEEANMYNFAKFFNENSPIKEAEELSRYVDPGSIVAIKLKGVLSLKKAEKTYGCIQAMAVNLLNIFITQRTLCRMLSKNTIDVHKLGTEKTALYIIVPDEKTTLHFLAATFIKQTYEILIGDASQSSGFALPRRVNFLLDEFSNIPKIPDMPSMITAARSRNMRFFLMAQGLFQLHEKYGYDAQTIIGNCMNLVFLTSRERGLLEMISQKCGLESYSDVHGNTFTRPLISDSKLQRLSKDKGEALIFHERHFPFISELPDIDEYDFTPCPAISRSEKELPRIVKYNLDETKERIKNHDLPLIFSEEEGEPQYYLHKPEPPKKAGINLADWYKTEVMIPRSLFE